MKCWFGYWALVAVLCVVQAAAAEEGKCSSDAATYACPNCGGIQVDDCLNCDGFLSTDTTHDICFQRHLFSHRNEDVTDPEHHYHYLWRDLVGMVVWFAAAGVATACGVGGGGIYVVRIWNHVPPSLANIFRSL
jgi:predicted RNA-binding Zn-ribbon protein involved in translation (DUF1610 family)